MISDATLGGYVQVHDRPPAFEGSDGAAYSVAEYVDDTPDERGRFGAALLFVRWSASGDQPVGHLETDYLAYGADPEAAAESIRALTLHEIKHHLDALIASRKESHSW